MTTWSFLVWICTPVPCFLLFLLTLPIPMPILRTVCGVSKRVLTFPLIGGLQAIHVMLIISAGAFAAQAYESSELRLQTTPEHAKDRIYGLAKIWRSERNFWIAALCFFVWWMLLSYHRILVKWLDLKEENQRLKEQLNPAQQESMNQEHQRDKKND